MTTANTKWDLLDEHGTGRNNHSAGCTALRPSGFRNQRQNHATGMEWMSSIADTAMKTHDKIDILLIMSNYEDADAKHDDYSNDVKHRSIERIRKYVVVGAPLFARAMIAFNGLIKPVETKTFSLSDEKDAWAYLAEAGPAST